MLLLLLLLVDTTVTFLHFPLTCLLSGVYPDLAATGFYTQDSQSTTSKHRRNEYVKYDNMSIKTDGCINQENVLLVM